MRRLTEIWEIQDFTKLSELCQYLLFELKAKHIVISGDLGAGKTTTVKLLGDQLGISTPMTSPTFALLNEYESNYGPVYHFDLYRLGDEEELLDLGFEEYLTENAWVFIEWPELVVNLLPEDFCRLNIEVTGPSSRKISIFH